MPDELPATTKNTQLDGSQKQVSKSTHESSDVKIEPLSVMQKSPSYRKQIL